MLFIQFIKAIVSIEFIIILSKQNENSFNVAFLSCLFFLVSLPWTFSMPEYKLILSFISYYTIFRMESEVRFQFLNCIWTLVPIGFSHSHSFSLGFLLHILSNQPPFLLFSFSSKNFLPLPSVISRWENIELNTEDNDSFVRQRDSSWNWKRQILSLVRRAAESNHNHLK